MLTAKKKPLNKSATGSHGGKGATTAGFHLETEPIEKEDKKTEKSRSYDRDSVKVQKQEQFFESSNEDDNGF